MITSEYGNHPYEPHDRHIASWPLFLLDCISPAHQCSLCTDTRYHNAGASIACGRMLSYEASIIMSIYVSNSKWGVVGTTTLNTWFFLISLMLFYSLPLGGNDTKRYAAFTFFQSRPHGLQQISLLTFKGKQNFFAVHTKVNIKAFTVNCFT